MTLFYALNDELKAIDPFGLDAVVRELIKQRDTPVNFAGLKAALADLGVTESPALRRMEALLPVAAHP